MPIKSATSYQVEITIIPSRGRLTPLIFRFCNFNIQMCSYLMLEIKSCFFKKRVFPILDKGTFQGGS